MKCFKTFGITLAVAAVGSSLALAEEPTFKELLDQLLPGMGAENIADREDPQQKFQQACFRLGSPGMEVQRAEACRLIAGKLGPDTAKPARIWLLKQLEHIGRGECVDAVAALLDDEDREIRQWALRALQDNPAPEATAALLAGVRRARDSSWQVALINSLGFRGDPASVGGLARLLGDPDQAVAAAAVGALGKIGGPKATEALAAAVGRVSPPLQRPIAHAYLRCADQLLKQGKSDLAFAIYKGLDKPGNPRPVRLAALQGTLNASGDKATRMVIELLASDDADVRMVAAGHIGNLADEVIKTLAAELPGLPAPGQVLLLGALAAKGDKSAMPVAVAAAKSDDRQVRQAAIRALGTLGDASVVPLLIEAVSRDDATSDAARESLQRVFGKGTDEAIVAAMQEADDRLRGTLLAVLDARNAVIDVPVLLREAEFGYDYLHDTALQILGRTADPIHLPAMIGLLLRTEKGRRRDDVEKAIVLVSSRIAEEEKRADPVLAALGRADETGRCILLPVLGRIGGPKALDVVRAAIRSDRARIQEAGVRALSNWPDAGAADELLNIAESSGNKTHRIWALRAYIRVVSQPSSRPTKQSLAMLKKAMQLATRNEEKQLILSRAAAVRDITTLRWVVSYLDDESLSTEASRAVVDLAHHRDLMGPNRAEFTAALEKVIKACKDRGLVERARRYLQGL